MDDDAVLCLAGLCLGAILGVAARAGRFCVMGAVEDWVLGEDTRRIRMILFAAAVAVAGTSLLIATGMLDPSLSGYLRADYPVVLAVSGGLLFGLGMAFVGTCGFGALARAGGGDLRALVLAGVIGIAAFAALTGVLEPLRLGLTSMAPGVVFPNVALSEMAGEGLGLPPLAPALAAAVLVGAVALSDRTMWPGAGSLLAAVSVGLAVPAAWAVTAHVQATGFSADPVEAFSFVQPLGETLTHIMRSGNRLPDFSTSVVIGVLLGAAISSGLRGEVRWEACDDAREFGRQIAGAVLMGVGGVLALGCTIGQGLSALSVLAPSAPLVMLSILIGARAGLLWLVGGSVLQR